MQPAKKNVTKVLSAISMAAAATLAAKSAQAQLVTSFYGQAQTGVSAGATDGVFIENSAKQFSSATFETIANTGTPTTISVPLGDYLFMAMDAVVTGNANPDGGKTTGATGGDPGAVQPANLGLSGLTMTILSNDNGSNLQPVLGTQIGGSPSYAQGFGYNTKVVLNTTSGNHTGGAYVPSWTATSSTGDAEQNNGSVGQNDFIGGGNTPSTHTGTAPIANQLGMFGGTAATDAQATTLFTSLQYQRTGTGTVTLTPTIDTAGSAYWHLTTAGSPTAPSIYAAVPLSASNIAALPVLVIKTASSGPTGHAIVSLTAGDATAAGYGAQVGSTLAVVGGNGSYKPVQTSVFSAVATGSAEVDPWNPVTDTEVFGVDVLDGGSQASALQLAALLTAINSGDANAPVSKVVASLSSPTPDPFGSQYNLFLTFSGTNLPGSALDTLGLDLSSTNDPLLTGLTFQQVAVVPEPMSLGLLMLGGMGLMARRNRRKA